MPTPRGSFRRIAWISSLLGSIGLAIAGVATAPNAGAASSPNFTYSSAVTAIGLQTAMFSSPEPSSVPDLTDVQTPSSDALLDSFGTSQSNAHVGNLNGLGQLPSLICLASSAFCKAIPVSTLSGGTVGSFPPPDPLAAQSTYPAHQSDSAPSVGSKKASAEVHNGPLTLGAGNAQSTARATSTSTSGVDSNVSVVSGVSIGSIRTTTRQVVTSAGLRTEALAEVSNIDIGTGHLLHIGSVRSILTVDSSPGKPSTDTASSQVGDVKVLGKSATIDSKGVHVSGAPGVPKAVTTAYQKTLDTFFRLAGFGMRRASISRLNGHTGHTVQVAGLMMFFKHTVKGTPPLTVGLPPGVPCPIKAVTSGFPVDPCAGIGLSLNAKYRGQIALGQVGAVSLAQPENKPVSPPTTLPGGAGKGGVGVGGGATGGTGGTGGVPAVNSGGVGGGPSAISGAGSGGASPTIAANNQALADPLSGLSGRLWWFFPLIAISVLGVAGRFRTPARLPSQ